MYSDEFYSHNLPSPTLNLKGEVCSNDPHYYQACDKGIKGKITNNELLCEYFICFDSNKVAPELGHFGTCSVTCLNTDLNKKGCNKEMVTMLTGRKVPPDKICNGRCDVWDCEDEALCNGYRYGLYCLDRWNNKPKYIPPRWICSGNPQCKHREDEENCTVTEQTLTESTCKHIFTGKLVPIYNYTRCTEMVKSVADRQDKSLYCKSSDVVTQQTNCSDPSRVGITCEINGYKSTVSKHLICFDNTISVCDDNIESMCLTTSTCKTHRHHMCDKINHCVDLADEKDQICNSITKKTCKRRLGNIKSELPIPIFWLKDGVKDCENGEDETADWPTCGEGKRKRYVSSKETECKNVFICRTGDPGFAELENLCDGIETCGNENKICSVSNRPQSLAISVPTKDKGLTKTLSHCLPGLSNLEHLNNVSCVTKQQLFPEEDIFGVTKTSVILPHKKVACDYVYGEQYLYTSCTGRCINATCPLRNIPRYEVCPSQYPDRIGTIVNNEYLIFVTKSHESVYTNRYFVCDDKIKCIEYSKVCDLIYDCNDLSDEAQCTNHFKCNSTGKLIPKTKKCDGQVDCFDFSDECNEQCSKEILKEHWLEGLSWLIGLSAVVANLVIIVKCLRVLKRCKTAVALVNRLLILMIALGDLLVGCYLFIIATFDGIVFKKSYCPRQITWITSLECSVIGVFSTIGSQISLLSMTCLSIVRMHGILNSMSIPVEVTAIKSLKIFVGILFLLFSSTAIAVIPIIEIFEDFFVNGIKFSDEIKIFVGTSNKATVLEVIQAYYGRTKDRTLDWKMFIQMIEKMFSKDPGYKVLTEKVEKVDFYGNDGVCLFKYFVQKDDPQRLFVWSIIAVNFTCFFCISVSYLMIGIFSRRSSQSLNSSQNNDQIQKRNNRMNQRIAIIIATDFLCWVPFILICVLHSLEVIDATPWYGIFSMVILPINSVINPLLYDDEVTKVAKVAFQASLSRVSNSDVIRKVRDSFGIASNETSVEAPDQSLKKPSEKASEKSSEKARAEAPRQIKREAERHESHHAPKQFGTAAPLKDTRRKVSAKALNKAEKEETRRQASGPASREEAIYVQEEFEVRSSKEASRGDRVEVCIQIHKEAFKPAPMEVKGQEMELDVIKHKTGDE